MALDRSVPNRSDLPARVKSMCGVPVTRTAIVFIHGLASGPHAWDPLRKLIETDDQFAVKPRCELFEYNSKLIGNRLLTRVPTYRTVADKLRTRFERYCEGCDGIVFVAHSQGGLVLQTFLSRMISAGNGYQLNVIKGIILIACPNGGSGIFLMPRRVLGGLIRHSQEKRLCPLDEEISDTHRHISLNIDRATVVSVSTCPIPIIAFAAENDGIVGRASAYGSFRTHGVLPGSHTTVIRPRSHADAGYQDLRNELQKALAWPAQVQSLAADRQLPAGPALMREQSPANRQNTTTKTNLPRRSIERLVGRDVETAELLFLLRSREGSLVLIDGAAGTGKTTVALHVCRELLECGSPPLDAVVWLSARTTLLQEEGQVPAALSASDLGDLTATIALTLDRRDLVHLPPDQRAIGVATSLSEMRSLVVLDNFETIGDPKVLAYLRDLPQSCSVVITSRRRIDLPHRIHLLPLEAGPTEELVRLELGRRRMRQRSETISWLVELSGGIPLAVNWLIGRVALGAPHLNPEAGELNDGELLKYLFHEGLGQVSGSGGLIPLLVLARPPGTVPSAMLVSALRDLGLVDAEAARAISALSTLNLIEYDAGSDRYSVLPVIKRFLLDPAVVAEERNPTVVTRVNEAYVRALVDHLERESQVLWKVGYTHNDWDRDRTNTINSIRGLLPHSKGPLTAALLNSFYPFAITFGHFNEFMEFTGTLLESAASLDRADTVALRARRASVLLHSGQIDAAAAELDIAEAAFVTLDDVSDALTNLVYFVRGIIAVTRRSPDAERILQEAITFEERRGVVWARLGFQGWLGLYLVDTGRLDEADTLLTRSLDECTRVGDFRTSVFVHVGLARLRLAQGAHDELIAGAPDVLTLASEFGEDHNRAHLHLAVARGYGRQSRPQEAFHHLHIARELYVRLGASLDVRQCDELTAALA